jgi:hypothetical protein
MGNMICMGLSMDVLCYIIIYMGRIISYVLNSYVIFLIWSSFHLLSLQHLCSFYKPLILPIKCWKIKITNYPHKSFPSKTFYWYNFIFIFIDPINIEFFNLYWIYHTFNICMPIFFISKTFSGFFQNLIQHIHFLPSKLLHVWNIGLDNGTKNVV